jgi:hypothetical protein
MWLVLLQVEPIRMSNKLELLMRKAARELRDQQICVLYKIPEEMQQTPCDFIGYTNTGCAILIECKQVKRPSLPIGKAPGLAAHQWRALVEADNADCVSLLVWQNSDQIAVIPVGEIQTNGRKSIAWRSIEDEWIITPDGCLSGSIADTLYLIRKTRR